MKTREENIRYINPQLYGCCAHAYIISNLVNCWYEQFGDISNELKLHLDGGFQGHFDRHIRNLELTYGKTLVHNTINNLFLRKAA